MEHRSVRELQTQGQSGLPTHIPGLHPWSCATQYPTGSRVRPSAVTQVTHLTPYCPCVPEPPRLGGGTVSGQTSASHVPLASAHLWLFNICKMTVTVPRLRVAVDRKWIHTNMPGAARPTDHNTNVSPYHRHWGSHRPSALLDSSHQHAH